MKERDAPPEHADESSGRTDTQHHRKRERRSGDRVRNDQRSGEGAASALSRLKMMERKNPGPDSHK